MSIERCVLSAVDQGVLSREEAQQLLDLYRRQLEFEATSGPGAAERAKKTLADEIAFAAAEKKRRAALTARALRDGQAQIAAYRTADGKADVAEGTISLLEGFRTGSQSVESLRKFLVSEAQARMDGVIEAFDRTKVTGETRNKPLLRQVVDELFGTDTGSAEARALANAWSDAAEWLRQRFNQAGGAIGKLENWGLPQAHDAAALLNAGRDKWKQSIRPLLDVARMKHPKTGRAVDAGELNAVLDEVYDTITTQRWNKAEPQMRPFGLGALANRHGDHRFLVFKDGASWLAYQRDFGGGGDAFEAMMGHIQIMARDIAAMERLGPNPDAMLHFHKQTILQQAALHAAGKPAAFAGSAKRAVSRANSTIKLIDDMWDEMRGKANTPVAQGWANLAANLRNVIVSARLGAASLSALASDPMFQAVARKASGLPVTTYVRDLARASGKHGRMEALRSNLILDSALNVFGTQARYLDTLQGSRWSRYMADRVLQLSGLTPWTQMTKHAFGLGMQAHFADQAGRAFSDLDPALRRMFDAWGIGAAMWDRMRAAALYEPQEGVRFLRPKELLQIDPEAGEKYVQMMLMETEYAVPSGTVRGRATLTGGTRPGTFWGEVVRSGLMFKSFSITVVMLQVSRVMRELHDSKARGAAYASALLLTATMGGALALWLKDLAAGRDPRPVTDKDGSPVAFIGQAALQGGGLGIFGDFILSDRNHYGAGLEQTIAGPVIGAGNEFLNLTVGNAIQLATGEETKFGREATRFVDGLTPGGNIWWLGLAYERVLVDSVQKLADPAANKSFKARQNAAKRMYGTHYWWRPGHALPDRMPAF